MAKRFILVAGNIGAGKTSLTERLGEKLGSALASAPPPGSSGTVSSTQLPDSRRPGQGMVMATSPCLARSAFTSMRQPLASHFFSHSR